MISKQLYSNNNENETKNNESENGTNKKKHTCSMY